MNSTTVVLGDVAEFVRGINFKPEDVVTPTTAGAVACLRTKNVQAQLDSVDVWGVDERFVRRADQFVSPGDILVSSANSWNLVGKCCWIPELPWKTTFGGFVSVLRAKRERIDPAYLYRWFSSDRIQTTVRSFGQQTTNISNLNTGRCLSLPLRLPDLADQKRIAGLLDQADHLRAMRRATLALLDSLASAVFVEMFGDPYSNPKNWPTASLGECALQVTDGEHLTPRRVSDGIKLLSARNIRHGYIDVSDVDFIDPSEYERIRRRCNPSIGDVLISCSGTIGRVTTVDTREPFALVRSVALVRPDVSLLSPEFLEHYLRTTAMQGRMWSQANASSQANLFQNQIRRLPVLLPPPASQATFAERITALKALSRKLSANLGSLDCLFASLQYQAFNGELSLAATDTEMSAK